MLQQRILRILSVLSLTAVAACSGTPYTPVASQVTPLDVNAYAPKVDAFVVLLDTSGSMKDESGGRVKIQAAQDLVASFNSAVPPLGFQAGLIIFGKGANSCWGYGSANTLYGLSEYQSADFGNALGSIDCAASTTPIADAINKAEHTLASQQGPTAVIIVSDFKWSDTDAVTEAVAQLEARFGSNVCLHTVKLGDYNGNDELINNITTGCGSNVAAADIAAGDAMPAYVASTLLTPLAPIQYETHTISAVTLFDFDRSTLKEQGKLVLYELGATIRDQGVSVVDINVVGHTDSVGTDAYNQALSERRALSVMAYLMAMGIDPGIIDAIGKGESEPVASNDTDEGRAENRRVEIHVGTARQ